MSGRSESFGFGSVLNGCSEVLGEVHFSRCGDKNRAGFLFFPLCVLSVKTHSGVVLQQEDVRGVFIFLHSPLPASRPALVRLVS